MGISPDTAWNILMEEMGKSVIKGRKLRKTNVGNFGGTIAQTFDYLGA